MGVRNGCGVPIEVVSNDRSVFPEGFLEFRVVLAGSTDRVGGASDDWERLFVWVRLPGDVSEGRRLVWERDEVVSGGPGEPEFVAVIEGSACPP